MRRLAALVLANATLIGCDSSEPAEDMVTREACGHASVYDGELDGTDGYEIKTTHQFQSEGYELIIDITDGSNDPIDGPGVSSFRGELLSCGEFSANVTGSAGDFAVTMLITSDSASGTWSSPDHGSGDFVAEVNPDGIP